MTLEIFAVGDSHSIIFSQMKNVHEHWLGFNTNLPLTMYRLANESIDLYTMPIMLGNGHEKFVPKAGDIVIFCYGYNDCNKNIYLQNKKGREVEEIMNTLVQNYIKELVNLQRKYNIIAIPYPVSPTTKMKKDTIFGTIEQRIEWTELCNNLLDKYSRENGLFFQRDLFDYIQGEDGCISSEYTTDGVHIDLSHVEHLENRILGFIINILME
jgi:hypothetical protein